MKKVLVLVVLVLLVFPTVTACDLFAPGVDEAKANYCDKLGAFGKAVVDLRQIDENSTLQDLQDSAAAAEDSLAELSDASAKLKTAQIGGVQKAFENLQSTISDVPSDASLGEAQIMVKQAVLDTLAQILETTRTECIYPAQ